MRALVTQFTRFGLVGLVGLAVDVGVFNLLLLTVLQPTAVHEGPIIAKVISTSLAIITNWMGNRHWTFRHDRRHNWLREGVEFGIISVL
jgi:putative flippase GtrA